MDVVGDLEMSVTEADNQGTSAAVTSQDQTDVVVKIEQDAGGEPVGSQLPDGNIIAGNGKAKDTDNAKRKPANTSKGHKAKKKVKRRNKSAAEKCQAESMHYQVMGWLAVNYRYNSEIIGWENMTSMDDVYRKYSDYRKGDFVCDPKCIARCADVLFAPQRFFASGLRYFPVVPITPEQPSAAVTLPPSCSYYYDSLDLIVKVKTEYIIDGCLVYWYIIWSDTKICVKFRDRIITLIKQAPPKHWVAFSQDNFDGILNLCKSIPFCRGFETRDDHLDEPELVVEGWASLVNPDKMDCRTRHKYCQIVNIPKVFRLGFYTEEFRSKVICSKCAHSKRMLQKHSSSVQSSEHNPQKSKTFLDDNAGQIQTSIQEKMENDGSDAALSSNDDAE